jgi:Tfp pilus assembly protein FimT
MAYGVKGYKYFSYWTLDHDSAPNTAAMVSKKGEKTDIYYAAQKVNHEVLAFDHVYLNYDWQGTMCVLGEGNKKNKCFSMLNNPLQSHERILAVKASQDTVIGTFKDKQGNDAFMVVNFSDPGYALSDTVELDLKGASKAVCYQNGKRTVVEAKKGKLVLELTPGNGVFVIPLQ